ncbi:MAG: alpha/beta hydrolase [Chitinophagaceae bacterium]|nr:alpha/beta hydrolase [Chitinophagaceae bacterium]
MKTTAYRNNRRRFITTLLCYTFIFTFRAGGQDVTYPYPLHHIEISFDDTVVSMAYMDVKPEQSNGKTILLLHGKNFSGYYWKVIIPDLLRNGFRVIAPDQVGWGHSGKPVGSYSFHQLARNTLTLLDTLKIPSTIVVGHSMGGMLATRFTIMYPTRVEKLVLENPIGLEDYRRFVPHRPISILVAGERKATYASYKKYQESYFPVWKPEYEQYVQAQAEQLHDPAFHGTIARVNAITYDMIYQQPVCYEWDRITVPVLLIIGQEDRTVVGKDQLTEVQKKKYGQYPTLGKRTQKLIPNAKLIELTGVGHIPHVQEPTSFTKYLVAFVTQ